MKIHFFGENNDNGSTEALLECFPYLEKETLIYYHFNHTVQF